MHNVTLYTRADCPLCEKAKAALREAAPGIVVTEVDIDADETLRERYTNDVPVVLIDGKEAFRHTVDRQRFQSLLRGGLASEKCIPCRGGVPPLKGEELARLASELGGGWEVVNEHHLAKEFPFLDFRSALEFTNRVGALAEEQGHHPDIHLAWGKAGITIWTHKVDGLTRSDFVLAAKIDQLGNT